MTDFTDTSLQIPTTSGNTGALVHHAQKIITAGTVLEPYFIPARKQIVTGVYVASTAQLTITQTVMNGTTTGFVWITNPTANTTRACRLRRVWGTSQTSAATTMPLAARVGLHSMTFTGTPSGAALTAAKLDSAYPAYTMTLNTAVTGLTTSIVNTIGSMAVMAVEGTAVTCYSPADINMLGPFGNEDEYYVLRPGEGCCIYQDVAGTSADTRLVNLNILFDEIDIT